MQARVSTHLRGFERRIVVGGHEESQQFRLVKLDVQIDLALMVLSRHFLVDEEDFVQE